MSDYQKISLRLGDMGLNLRDSPDIVKENQWTRLTNCVPDYEGSINTRKGRTPVYTVSGPVHSAARLSNSTLLIGAGTDLYRNTTPYTGTTFSGSPLQIVTMAPSAEIAATWAYIGDAMRKVDAVGRNYKWGIAGPSAAATYATSGAGALNSGAPGASVYDYKFTYYSTLTTAESNGSPDGVGITATNEKVSVNIVASSDPQVDTIRIWRRGGTILDGWALCGTTGNANGAFEDNAPDSDIYLNPRLDLDNDVPFTSVDSTGSTLSEVPMPYVWGPFFGQYILATGDPNRPHCAYWTNAGRFDSASPANFVEVTKPSEPLMSGFLYGALPFVWTADNCFALDFAGLDAVPTFQPRKTPVGRGLSGPYAFAVGPMVWFVSKDGIYQTDCSTPAEPITEPNMRPIFQGQTIEDIAPIDYNYPDDIRLQFAGQDLHLFYKGTDSERYHFVFHIGYKRWRREHVTTFSEIMAYQDENQAGAFLYIGGDDGKLYLVSGTDDDGTAIQCNARTGSVAMEAPQTYKEFGNAILDSNTNGGVLSVTTLLNAESSSLAPITVITSSRTKTPISLQDTYAYSIAFDFQWSGQAALYQFDYMWRMDEESVTHWEFPETAHGFPGWQQVRDVYIAGRFLADAELKVVIDGTQYSYTIPSTGGERRKQHVWLEGKKGKMFRYIVDSGSQFRIYGEDCEVRVKPWNTALGYQLISPFRAVQ